MIQNTIGPGALRAWKPASRVARLRRDYTRDWLRSIGICDVKGNQVDSFIPFCPTFAHFDAWGREALFKMWRGFQAWVRETLESLPPIHL